MSSEERFGFEWNKYNFMDENYKIQFERWVFPLVKKDFENKKVLDAGCGMGRNSYWTLSWGAERVTAFDCDTRSVEAAKKNLINFKNAEVFYKSIYDIDWNNEFDIAFSIGVVHHLKNPKAALQNLVKSLKSRGKLLIWVYSREGNGLVVKVINPIRKLITSKLPVRLTYFLSYFFSAPLFVFLKIFRPKNSYLNQLRNFKFWHIHSIVFDQLIPDIANYWTKKEVEELMSGLGLKEFSVSRPSNGQGWTAVGMK